MCYEPYQLAALKYIEERDPTFEERAADLTADNLKRHGVSNHVLVWLHIMSGQQILALKVEVKRKCEREMMESFRERMGHFVVIHLPVLFTDPFEGCDA